MSRFRNLDPYLFYSESVCESFIYYHHYYHLATDTSLLQTCEALSPHHNHVKFSTFLKRNRSTSFDLAWTRFGAGSCCRPCCQACASHSHQLRFKRLSHGSWHPSSCIGCKKGGVSIRCTLFPTFYFYVYAHILRYVRIHECHDRTLIISTPSIRIADIVFSSGSALSSGLAHHRTH